MTSEERRAARRARREAERARRRAERNSRATLDDVADTEALWRAQRDAGRGVNWKASTQRYRIDWLINGIRARHTLLSGGEVCRGFHEFDVVERGKVRHIQSVHFSERVVQKSLTQVAYVSTMAPCYIADNSANVRGRGTSYATARVKQALASHYAKYGTEGWVLQVDFRGFFASIDHDGAKAEIRRHVTDPHVVALGEHLVDAQGGTRGLGLGSEPNQMLAVGYPDPIDHFVREVCRPEYYGRYMDDIIVIDRSKLTLQIILAQIRAMCAELKLEVNERKTHLVRLTKGFTFLKVRYFYSDTGKVVMRPCRDSITRERRKIKAHARLVQSGQMTYEQAWQSYQSWRGSKLRLNAHGTVLRMDALFSEQLGPLRKDQQHEQQQTG